MAFTNIPNGNLQVGAPLRSVDILALRDNIPAVMNGDTGAPKIKAAAFEGQSGAAPVFAARAWVNFNGEGTVAIRASGNVSSITDNGVGDYTINFTTAMPDSNYAVTGTSSAPTLNALAVDCVKPFIYSTSSVRIGTTFGSVQVGLGNAVDRLFVNVSITR